MKWKFCAKSAWSGRGHGLPLKSNGWEDPFPSSNLAVILTCWTNVYPSVGEIPMFGWLYPAMIGSLWISVPYCWLYSQTSSITSCFIQAKGELNPLLANHSVPILVKSCEMTKSFMDGKVRSNRFWKLSIVIPCFFPQKPCGWSLFLAIQHGHRRRLFRWSPAGFPWPPSHSPWVAWWSVGAPTLIQAMGGFHLDGMEMMGEDGE